MISWLNNILFVGYLGCRISWLKDIFADALTKHQNNYHFPLNHDLWIISHSHVISKPGRQVEVGQLASNRPGHACTANCQAVHNPGAFGIESGRDNAFLALRLQVRETLRAKGSRSSRPELLPAIISGRIIVVGKFRQPIRGLRSSSSSSS